MRLSASFFSIVGIFGTLAHATTTNIPSSLEKRIGHTGWMASYPADDIFCNNTKGYIDSTLPWTRPTLNWNGLGVPTEVPFQALTDNIGIYFGSGTNAFKHVQLYHGGPSVAQLDVVGTIGHDDSWPGAWFSAKANGYPWSYVGVKDSNQLQA